MPKRNPRDLRSFLWPNSEKRDPIQSLQPYFVDAMPTCSIEQNNLQKIISREFFLFYNKFVVKLSEISVLENNG